MSPPLSAGEAVSLAGDQEHPNADVSLPADAGVVQDQSAKGSQLDVDAAVPQASLRVDVVANVQSVRHSVVSLVFSEKFNNIYY